jgi:subtilisin family serine protease
MVVRLVAALMVCLIPALAGSAATNKIKRSPKPVPGAWIVMLNDDINDEVGYILDDLVKKHKAKLTAEFEPLLKGGAFDLTELQAQAISDDPRVKAVWEQTEIELAATVMTRSWNVDRIDNRTAPRLDGSYTCCTTGKGVRAYVVDTGIWGAHDEFSNPNPLTGGLRVPLGYDYDQVATGINRSNNPPCSHSEVNEGQFYNGGHGTAVASVLGGRTLGAATEVTLVPIRIADCYAKGGADARVIAGLKWIITDPGYRPDPVTNIFPGRVVNMSFVQEATSSMPNPLEEAVDTLIGQGITVVAAAGNQNTNIAGYSPARYGPPIIAGGTKGRLATNADARWDDGPTGNLGSNYGPSIDLFAPADRVLVARWSSATAVSDPENNAVSSGTSFAAPLVAAAAARFLQLYPAESNSQIAARLIAMASTSANGVNMLNLMGSPNRLLYMTSDCKRRSAGS